MGGSADEAKYAQHFARMELVNAATGQPGPEDPEGGPQFASTDSLIVQTQSTAEVAVRACVEQRRAGGQIVFDQTQTLLAGPGSLALGSFAPGSYVVRVVVDDTLVKNLTFLIS